MGSFELIATPNPAVTPNPVLHRTRLRRAGEAIAVEGSCPVAVNTPKGAYKVSLSASQGNVVVEHPQSRHWIRRFSAQLGAISGEAR